jgi:hypothetical protein
LIPGNCVVALRTIAVLRVHQGQMLFGAPDLLGEAQMSAAPFSARRAIGVVLATLLGLVFFNALLGVFGLSAAIIALLLFISLAVLIFYARSLDRTQS